MIIVTIEIMFKLFNSTCPHACLSPHPCAILFGHVLDAGRDTLTHRSAWLVVTQRPTAVSPPPVRRGSGHSSEQSGDGSLVDTQRSLSLVDTQRSMSLVDTLGSRHPRTLDSGNGIRPYEYRHVHMEADRRSALSAGWEGGGHGSWKSAYLHPQTRGWIGVGGSGGGSGVGPYDTADLRYSQKKRVREVCVAWRQA